MPTNIEKAASKAMGAAKKAKGTMQGFSGIFETLMKEHGEVSALLMKAKLSSDAETRMRLWTTIRKELLAHEKGEMAVLYPVYEEYPEISELAAEHNEEAAELAGLIKSVDGIATSDASWEPTFASLVDLVQHHVKEEESTIFKAGQETFEERTDELKQAYLIKKDQLMLQS